MADGLAAKKAALTVLEKSWGDGRKNPPSLDAWLSNETTVRISIDDVLELKSYRLFTGGGDCVGRSVEYHHIDLEPDVLDALIAEVAESNRQWWAEHTASDMGAGGDL